MRSVFWLSVENSDSIMVTWRSTCHACIYRCWSQYQKNRTHFTEPKMNRSSRTKCGMPLNKYFIFFANKFKMCSPNWDHYWASVQKIRRLVQKGIKPNRKKFWWLVVSWAKKKHNSKHHDGPRSWSAIRFGTYWPEYKAKWRCMGIVRKRCVWGWRQCHQFFESYMIRLGRACSLRGGLILYKIFSTSPVGLNHVAFEKLKID